MRWVVVVAVVAACGSPQDRRQEPPKEQWSGGDGALALPVALGVAAARGEPRGEVPDDPDERARPAGAGAADLALSSPLPARETDAQTRRLAQEARDAAGDGDCEMARARLEVIAARDREYHGELVALLVFEACR